MTEDSDTNKFYDLLDESIDPSSNDLDRQEPTAEEGLQFLSSLSSRGRPAARSSDEDRPDTTVSVPSYEIEEQIGRGGFARVYRARHKKTGRTVALKILNHKIVSPENHARFLRETRTLARFKHENIVRIHHVIDEAEVHGLSMELIDGRTLTELIDAEGPMSAEQVTSLGVSLCRALTVVHDANYVHRDIKPQNVMREHGSNARFVLMDFGLSRSMTSGITVTHTGDLVGTPTAMAPEQYQDKKADARTDIYALGCLLFQAATGVGPVQGRTLKEVRDKVLKGALADLSELRPQFPVALKKTIERALETNPARRFPSASAMEKALLVPTESGSTPRITRFSTTVLVALIGAIVTLLGVIGYLIYLALS